MEVDEVASEAAWRLVPAFHGQWEDAWTIAVLADRLPPVFSAHQADQALNEELVRASRSSTHHATESAPLKVGAWRRALEEKRWLLAHGEDLELCPGALDTAMLMRLIVGRRTAIFPSEAMTRVGQIKPGPRRSQDRTAR